MITADIIRRIDRNTVGSLLRSPFSSPLPGADSTIPVSIFPYESIFGASCMSIATMGLRALCRWMQLLASKLKGVGPFAYAAPSHVFGLANRLQMFWVNTSLHAASVIKDHPQRDWSLMKLISKPMRSYWFTHQHKLTIAVLSTGRRPDPAATALINKDFAHESP